MQEIATTNPMVQSTISNASQNSPTGWPV